MDEDGNISVNIFDNLDSLSPDALDRLSREIACFDTIIESVSEQILCGVDKAGYGGATSLYGASLSTPLDIARRRVAKGASDAANLEISRLENALRYKDEVISGHRRLIDQMRRLGAEDAYRSAQMEENGATDKDIHETVPPRQGDALPD